MNAMSNPKTDTQGARRILLPSFQLTQTCSPSSDGATVVSVPGRPDVNYSTQPVSQPNSFTNRPAEVGYNRMPLVLDKNGIPWDEANLFVLDRLMSTTAPAMATFRGLADDLAAYRQFLDAQAVDYLAFPRKKFLRPTYRYQAHIKQSINLGEIAATTGQRRMATVVRFYRWLADSRVFTPENPPWVDGDVYITYADHKGFKQSKTVQTTDVAIRVPTQEDPFTDTIQDGGALRPLTPEEQFSLLATLNSLGNTEMRLMHLVALFTGARIQTVLTLRVKHIRREGLGAKQEIPIAVGPGTGVDTKNGKKMNIFIPRWLYEQLGVYSRGERAQKRYAKAGGDHENQYLFISNRGTPFYTSKADRMVFDAEAQQRYEQEGQPIRQFIADHVLPAMRQVLGSEFKYRFHDLRASFGMNLTEQQMSLVEQGKATLHQVREFVRVRMGHESSATTDLYLNYKQRLQHVRHVVADHESHLHQLMQCAMTGPL